jgi:hypothetical protein
LKSLDRPRTGDGPGESRPYDPGMRKAALVVALFVAVVLALASATTSYEAYGNWNAERRCHAKPRCITVLDGHFRALPSARSSVLIAAGSAAGCLALLGVGILVRRNRPSQSGATIA